MADLQNDPPAESIAVGDLDDVAPPRREPSTEPAAPAAAGPAAGSPAARSLERARELLAAHPIADGCSGLGLALREIPSYDIEDGERMLETDIPRLRDGGVGAQFWSLHVRGEPTGDRAVTATLEQLDLVRALVAECPEGLRLALSAA